MANFVTECPKCKDAYLEVNTNLDGIKSIFKGMFLEGEKTNVCSKCDFKYGYFFESKKNRLSNRKCSKCQSNVVYDRTLGENAKCPVCKNKINTEGDNSKQIDISCPQCGCGLPVKLEGQTMTECPICDLKNIDVKKEIELAKIAKSGLASVIKYEGDNNTFVWKHPVEDFNIGSQLIVHESQEAIFFRNGKALDCFTAGRYALETESIPLINQLYNSVLGPKDVFHSEVYYINMTTQMALKWGTDSKVRFLEPVTGIPFDIGASGEFNIRVADSRKLIVKLVGTDNVLSRDALLFTKESESANKSVSGYFRSMIMTRVKTHLAKTIKENHINLLEIDEHLEALSSALRVKLNEGLEEYGLTMPEFFVTTIVTPDGDANFIKLKQQHADLYLRVRDEQNLKKVRESEAERRFTEEQMKANMKIIESQGDAGVIKIKAEAEAEAYRLQAKAEADEMQMKGYTYVQESQRQIGLETVKGGVVKEGSGGGGAGSAIGDVVGLGVTLGAIGGVMGMAKEAITPIINTSTDMGKVASGIVNTPNIAQQSQTNGVRPYGDGWNCVCGEVENAKKFCANCGLQKPTATTWDCGCGNKAIVKKFCDECGKKREDESGGA